MFIPFHCLPCLISLLAASDDQEKRILAFRDVARAYNRVSATTLVIVVSVLGSCVANREVERPAANRKCFSVRDSAFRVRDSAFVSATRVFIAATVLTEGRELQSSA